MAGLALPPEIGERLPPSTGAVGGVQGWVGPGLGLLAVLTLGVATALASVPAAVVGVTLAGVALALTSPAVRDRVPGLRPGWMLLARGYGLEVAAGGPSWKLRGEVGGAPITVRVEAAGAGEVTVVEVVLPPVDLSVRLATERDAPDDLGRRFEADLVVQGRDAELLVLWDAARRAQLVRDLSAGMVFDPPVVRKRWPGAQHEVEALRRGLIAGPVASSVWLRRVVGRRVEELIEASRGADDAELAKLVAVLSSWDPGHPALGALADRLRTSAVAQARMIAGVVLEEPSVAFPVIAARSVAPAWQRWALQRLLRSSEPSVAERAVAVAVAHGSPSLLWDLSDAGRLSVEEMELLARRWPQLDPASWDCEVGHQLLTAMVDLLAQVGRLDGLLEPLAACPGFVRRAVAEAVARLDRPESVARLAALRDDPDPVVASSVRRAIEALALDEDVLYALRRAVPSPALLVDAGELDEVDPDDEPTVERTASRLAREVRDGTLSAHEGETYEPEERTRRRGVPGGPTAQIALLEAFDEELGGGALLGPDTEPSLHGEGPATPAWGMYEADEGPSDPHVHLLPVLEEAEGWGEVGSLLDREGLGEPTVEVDAIDEPDDPFTEELSVFEAAKPPAPEPEPEPEPLLEDAGPRVRRSLLGRVRRG